MKTTRRGSKSTGNEKMLRVLVSNGLFEQMEVAARSQETSVSEFVRRAIRSELVRQMQQAA